MNKIINNVQQFFQNNQKIFGIVLIIIGVILFVYTSLTTGKKLLQNDTNRYRIKDFINIFGEKIGGIAVKIFEYIIAISLIIAGIVFLII